MSEDVQRSCWLKGVKHDVKLSNHTFIYRIVQLRELENVIQETAEMLNGNSF